MVSCRFQWIVDLDTHYPRTDSARAHIDTLLIALMCAAVKRRTPSYVQVELD